MKNKFNKSFTPLEITNSNMTSDKKINGSKKKKSLTGFTLVELLVSVSLFVVVATISIGAILAVFDANKKAQSSKTVVDNLNLAIENMARTVRFGGSYYCGVSSNLTATIDCPNNGDSAISVTFNDSRIIYSLNGTAIQKKEGNNSYENITSSDTVIDFLKFYVYGTTFGDTQQPYVLVVVKGHVGSSNKPSVQTSFSIQTVISQRVLDR